jgi:phosphatidylglycerophosphatase A
MMFDNELIKTINLKNPAVILATWFGCGLTRLAPGTWGTLGGLPFGVLILFYGGLPILVIATIIVFVIGYWASERFEKMTGNHDDRAIVIDEVVGGWIALMAAGTGLFSIVLAFLLFRFFDILKPWPVSWADQKLNGPMSVMFDDVLAGIYAAIVILGFNYAISGI